MLLTDSYISLALPALARMAPTMASGRGGDGQEFESPPYPKMWGQVTDRAQNSVFSLPCE